MLKRKISTMLVIVSSIFIIGCGSNEVSSEAKVDGNGHNAEDVGSSESSEKFIADIDVSTSIPWNKKSSVTQEEKDIVEEAKLAIEGDIALYKSGASVSILNNCISDTSVFYSNRPNYFQDITLDKYVIDKTNFEVIGIEAVDNLNAKILLKISYVDINLPIFKVIKEGKYTKSQLVSTTTYDTIREVIEKDEPKTQDSYIILNYVKRNGSDKYLYVTKNNIRKALTAGIVQGGVSLLLNDKKVNAAANELVNNSIKMLKSTDLTDFCNGIQLGETYEKVKAILENEGLKKARTYFANNTKVEIIDGKENSYYKALVTYPNFNDIVNEGILKSQNTNEIIKNINDAIDNNTIDIIEDTLNDEISDFGNGVKLSGEYEMLLTNLGIDSMDMLMTDFSEPYTFKLNISGLETKKD